MDAGRQPKLNTYGWGMSKTNTGQAKVENKPSSEVVVAVIGDEVDISHAAGVITGTPNQFSNYGAETVDIMPMKIFDGSEKPVRPQGTGFAAPVVSGMAAGLLAQNPDMTTDEVNAALQARAAELGWQTNDR